MPRLPLIAAAAALLLSACTPMQWVRPDVTPEQAQLDLAYCQQEAWREARWRSFMYRPYGPMLLHDPWGRRFIWGHPAFGGPFHDEFMEEARLAHFCMRAKGYDLVPVEPAG
jgi:hypothetical protein